VADLVENFEVVKQFQLKARKLCDIERLLTQVYGFSVKSITSEITYIDYSSNMKLTLFRKLLVHLNRMVRVLPEVFETFKQDFKSERLRRLVSLKAVLTDGESEEAACEDADSKEFKLLETEDGLFDNILPLLQPFET